MMADMADMDDKMVLTAIPNPRHLSDADLKWLSRIVPQLANPHLDDTPLTSESLATFPPAQQWLIGAVRGLWHRLMIEGAYRLQGEDFTDEIERFLRELRDDQG